MRRYVRCTSSRRYPEQVQSAKSCELARFHQQGPAPIGAGQSLERVISKARDHGHWRPRRDTRDASGDQIASRAALPFVRSASL